MNDSKQAWAGMGTREQRNWIVIANCFARDDVRRARAFDLKDKLQIADTLEINDLTVTLSRVH